MVARIGRNSNGIGDELLNNNGYWYFLRILRAIRYKELECGLILYMRPDIAFLLHHWKKPFRVKASQPLLAKRVQCPPSSIG